MAVSTEATIVIYQGNATPGVPYPVPFRVDEEEHLLVGVRPDPDAWGSVTPFNVLPPADYTVTLFPETGLAEVVTAIAYTADSEVGIWREVPMTQTREYSVSGPFPAKSHEAALDKLTMLVQQVDNQQDHALTIRQNTEQEGYHLIPPPVPGVVGFDSANVGTIFPFPGGLDEHVRPSLLKATVSAVNPTVTDIPDGFGALWINTAQPVPERVRLWVNHGGSFYSLLLGDASP